VSAFLSRLDGVKEVGKDKYKAKCPAHDDRTPSLSVKECDDGRTLIHCFAGCDPESILDAVGLTFADIMPERLTDMSIKPQKWLNPADALATLDHESLAVAIIGADILASKEMTPDSEARLLAAVGRINDTRAQFARCRK
jgi:hypothetical protein